MIESRLGPEVDDDLLAQSDRLWQVVAINGSTDLELVGARLSDRRSHLGRYRPVIVHDIEKFVQLIQLRLMPLGQILKLSAPRGVERGLSGVDRTRIRRLKRIFEGFKFVRVGSAKIRIQVAGFLLLDLFYQPSPIHARLVDLDPLLQVDLQRKAFPEQ